MTTTQQKMPPMVQMYDKSVVREYVKLFKGFFSTSMEIVSTETISNTLELHITADRMPDVIYFNGEEVLLKSAKEKIQ